MFLFSSFIKLFCLSGFLFATIIAIHSFVVVFFFCFVYYFTDNTVPIGIAVARKRPQETTAPPPPVPPSLTSSSTLPLSQPLNKDMNCFGIRVADLGKSSLFLFLSLSLYSFFLLTLVFFSFHLLLLFV